MQNVPFHAKTKEEALSALNTAPQGLTGEEAKARLLQHGENRLTGQKPRTKLLLSKVL